jgi:hypothetical protein
MDHVDRGLSQHYRVGVHGQSQDVTKLVKGPKNRQTNHTLPFGNIPVSLYTKSTDLNSEGIVLLKFSRQRAKSYAKVDLLGLLQNGCIFARSLVIQRSVPSAWSKSDQYLRGSLDGPHKQRRH